MSSIAGSKDDRILKQHFISHFKELDGFVGASLTSRPLKGCKKKVLRLYVERSDCMAAKAVRETPKFEGVDVDMKISGEVRAY